METSGNNQPDLLASTPLEVNEESSNHLKDAGVWAKTIAIILCVVCGLLLIVAGYFGTVFGGLAFGLGDSYVVGLVIAVVVIGGLAALFIINLFRFSSGITSGVASQDAAEFERGITGLRNYFIFSGVLALLFSLFYFVRLIS